MAIMAILAITATMAILAITFRNVGADKLLKAHNPVPTIASRRMMKKKNSGLVLKSQKVKNQNQIYKVSRFVTWLVKLHWMFVGYLFLPHLLSMLESWHYFLSLRKRAREARAKCRSNLHLGQARSLDAPLESLLLSHLRYFSKYLDLWVRLFHRQECAELGWNANTSGENIPRIV